MCTKKTINLGVLLVLTYIGVAGTANIMLARYLEQYDPFCITAICFTTTTVYFTLIRIRRLPSVYRLYKANTQNFVLLNIYTAINWLAFYGALAVLEPVVVITIVNVVGTIVNHITSSQHRSHLLGYGLAIVVLVVYSISPHWPNQTQCLYVVTALFLAHVSGYSIEKTVVLSKRLYQVGLQTVDAMSIRFYLLILVCVTKVIFFKSNFWLLQAQDIIKIIVLGSLSAVVPIYILQVAYRYTTTKQILITLSFAPLFIFLLQFFVTARPLTLWVALSVMLVSLTSVLMVFTQKKS